MNELAPARSAFADCAPLPEMIADESADFRPAACTLPLADITAAPLPALYPDAIGAPDAETRIELAPFFCPALELELELRTMALLRPFFVDDARVSPDADMIAALSAFLIPEAATRPVPDTMNEPENATAALP